MSLRQCMQETSYREYLLWTAYLEEEWEQPSRSDYYLMQIALEVRRVLSKRPNSIQLKHMRIKFNKTNSSQPSNLQSSKNFWYGIVSQLKGDEK